MPLISEAQASQNLLSWHFYEPAFNKLLWITAENVTNEENGKEDEPRSAPALTLAPELGRLPKGLQREE